MAEEFECRVWRVKASSPAGVQISHKTAILVGNDKNFIAASDIGLVMMSNQGISFGTTSENMRISGIFVGMPDFIKMFPSSMVTPLPANIPVPATAMGTTIARDMPFFTMLASGTAVT